MCLNNWLLLTFLPSPFTYLIDFKSQPEPSPVLSQLSQRQQHHTQPVAVPPPGLESFPSQVKLRESTPRDSTSTVNKLLQLPSMTVENIAVTAHQPQPKHVKLPKRRIAPASKVCSPSRSHNPNSGYNLTFSSRAGLVSLRHRIFCHAHSFLLYENWLFLSAWANIRGNGFLLEIETVNSKYWTWLREFAGLVYLAVSHR